MAIITTDTLKFREYVGDAWKNLLLQANMDFNLIYPVGSIYMSTNNTNPALLFGGTWEQLENRFLLGAGSSYTAGNTGGKASYAAADMPKHSHTKGTMNITGNTKYISSNAVWSGTNDGAFRGYSNSGAPSITNVATSGTASGYYFKFNAADGWTGSTSEVGTNTNATIMPPYLVVYMWKRLTLAPHLPYPTNVMTDIGEVATAFSIPASGSSVSYNMTGMTNEYELVKWNFSSSPENIPPVNLTCTTYDGYFTVTNNGGTTSETIRPMFIKAKKIAVTAH